MNDITTQDKNLMAIRAYDKLAQRYTETYLGDETDFPPLDKFLSKLPKKAKVLDVGCGSGRFTPYLAGNGMYVEGIDLSQKMIEISQQRVPAGIFRLMDMRKTTYSNDTFDGLVLGYSIIHIPPEEITQTLKEMYRILKSGGYIIIMSQKGSGERITSTPLNRNEKLYFNFFTLQQLELFLTQNHFNIIYQEEQLYHDPLSLSDSVIYIIGQKGQSTPVTSTPLEQ